MDNQSQVDAGPAARQSIGQAVPDVGRLLGFQLFNAINFQIALGPPLVLMVLQWGASNLYIGAITALVPLLTTLQIYMAPRVEYIGYRRVIISGWMARNLALAAACVLALLGGRVEHKILLILLFIVMIYFNLLRGLATAGWMPWLCTLVPQNWRGRYLSLEQLAVNVSATLTFVGCGMMLGGHATPLRFGILFGIAFAAGLASLYFLRNVAAPPAREGKPVLEPFLNWSRRVMADRGFSRLIVMNIGFSLGFAAWATFLIVFMREELRIKEGDILYISAANTLGCVGGALAWGKLADRFGSKPVMALTTRLMGVIVVCWALVSVGWFDHSLGSIGTLVILMGMFQIGFVVGNSRYCLNNAPAAMPVLALTLFSVVTSLANAMAPVLWGSALDALQWLRWEGSGVSVSPFTAFFVLTGLVLVITKVLIRRIPDAPAEPTHVLIYFMVNDYPLRSFNAVYKALFQRGRGQAEDVERRKQRGRRKEDREPRVEREDQRAEP